MEYKTKEKTKYLLGLFLVASLFFGFRTLASETDGTIDLLRRYAWSENAG